MYLVLAKLLAYIAIGVGWRYLKPMKLGAGGLQRSLTALLYNVLLPALVLQVLWKAPLNLTTLRVAAATIGTTALGMLTAWLFFRIRRTPLSARIEGAFILAAGFGNVLLLGAPLTTSLVSSWTLRTAVQFEVFAIFPLLFIAALFLVSGKYGEVRRQEAYGLALIKQPMFWAAAAGILLNAVDVGMPRWLNGWLSLLVLGLTPLMLITVGLALYWNRSWNQITLFMLPVAAIQLVLLPLFMWGLFHLVGLGGPQTFKSLILQAAMPAMTLGFVFCERYKLEVGAYAAAFALTTALSLLTIPAWLHILRAGWIS